MDGRAWRQGGNLKEFRRANTARPPSLASGKELLTLPGLTPGSVTPPGLLNDKECLVEFYLDFCFLEGKRVIGYHPNDNTVTMWIKAQNLID